MIELNPTPVTTSIHSDLVLAERPFHSDQRDVLLIDELLIEGNSLSPGGIRVPGAKNAALPTACAALLTAEPLVLSSMPNLQDVRMILRLLCQMGMEGVPGGHNLTLGAATIHTSEASYDLVKTMRASILVLGPLLARFGHVRMSLPGGCDIDARPVDQRIKGLQLMGAEIVIKHSYVEAKPADGAKRLRGVRIVTDMVTVTDTENLLMTAAPADGGTVLKNATRKPEVTNLADLLMKMSVHIGDIDTNRLIIQGVEALRSAAYTMIIDRIEAGTFLYAAAAADGDVTLCVMSPDTFDAVLDKLREAGVTLITGDDWICVRMTGRPKAASFHTPEYPAFPADMQAQFIMLNAIVEGSTTVTETIFENHLMHVQELSHLGANTVIEDRMTMVTGVEQSSDATVMATDLCASASLVIAGLIAQSETLVDRVYHLDRGYDRIEDKLSIVGAKTRRIQG